VRQLQVGEARQVGDGFSGHEVFLAIRNGNGTFATALGAANTGSGRIVNGTVTDPAQWQAHALRVVFTSATTYDVVDDTAGATVLSGQPWVRDAAISVQGISLAITGTPAAGDEFHAAPAANQSLFETLDQAIDVLQTEFHDPASEAVFHDAMDRVLGDVDQAREAMLEVRASIGARMNTLQSQQAINEDLTLQLQSIRSSLQDADIVEVVSQLAQQTNALQAAQAAFVRVQGLSLFNFF
jgi:flagellar hook-associated protein 3 FlgL